MATINTIEDLLRLLDENPEWLEALRARLLTRELLELPQTVANLTAEVAALSEKVAALSAEVAALSAEVRAFTAATNARFDRVDARFDRVDACFDRVETRLDGVDARFDRVDARFDRVETRLDRVESGIQSLRNDMGPLKAGHARSAAERNAAAIADDLGLRLTGVLTQSDLYALTDHADTSGIPKNTLRSFNRADLVIEATDAQGETCYVAVEISFTANGRDTERAVRNAELLARFTGKVAHAVVAGERIDDRIRKLVDSGTIVWFELTPDLLDVA